MDQCEALWFRLIEAWPRLPEALQAALATLAEALAEALTEELEKAESPESVNTREDD